MAGPTHDRRREPQDVHGCSLPRVCTRTGLWQGSGPRHAAPRLHCLRFVHLVLHPRQHTHILERAYTGHGLGVGMRQAGWRSGFTTTLLCTIKSPYFLNLSGTHAAATLASAHSAVDIACVRARPLHLCTCSPVPLAVDLCLVLATVWCSAPQMTNLSIGYEALSNKSCTDMRLCSSSCALTADDDSPGRFPCARAPARFSPPQPVRCACGTVRVSHSLLLHASCAGVHMRESKTGEYMLSKHGGPCGRQHSKSTASPLKVYSSAIEKPPLVMMRSPPLLRACAHVRTHGRGQMQTDTASRDIAVSRQRRCACRSIAHDGLWQGACSQGTSVCCAALEVLLCVVRARKVLLPILVCWWRKRVPVLHSTPDGRGGTGDGRGAGASGALGCCKRCGQVPDSAHL